MFLSFFFSFADLKTISAPRCRSREPRGTFIAQQKYATRQTEFSALEKRTDEKHKCYAKPGKMYAREHIYGVVKTPPSFSVCSKTASTVAVESAETDSAQDLGTPGSSR